MNRSINLTLREHGLLAINFAAMASPCELLLATEDRALAERLGQLAATETWRIEAKFSRYRDDSIITQINRANGKPITLDGETSALLNYAQQCYQLSEGRFDITSGVLRKLWNFKDASVLPTQQQIDALKPFIGFDKLTWREPELIMPSGMELDFGGIGKEYAVDRVYQLLQAQCDHAVLVNFGGDLRASKPPASGPWRVGVEKPDHPDAAQFTLAMHGGGLATSGNTRRYFMVNGVRYGHILDPRTGWPVPDAPLSVTVIAHNCTTAGMFCTFAMLQGAQAEAFLAGEQVQHWCLR